MDRTWTPDPAPAVRDRLAEDAAGFPDDFNRPRQAAWRGVYLRGLVRYGPFREGHRLPLRSAH